MMTIQEKLRALADGKVLVDDEGNEAWLDEENESEPLRYSYLRGRDEALDFETLAIDNPPWRIKEPKQTRPMTRDEILGFLANTSGIVVRCTPTDSWELPESMSFLHSFDYEWATISYEGVIGEPMRFEV